MDVSKESEVKSLEQVVLYLTLDLILAVDLRAAHCAVEESNIDFAWNWLYTRPALFIKA